MYRWDTRKVLGLLVRRDDSGYNAEQVALIKKTYGENDVDVLLSQCKKIGKLGSADRRSYARHPRLSGLISCIIYGRKIKQDSSQAKYILFLTKLAISRYGDHIDDFHLLYLLSIVTDYHQHVDDTYFFIDFFESQKSKVIDDRKIEYAHKQQVLMFHDYLALYVCPQENPVLNEQLVALGAKSREIVKYFEDELYYDDIYSSSPHLTMLYVFKAANEINTQEELEWLNSIYKKVGLKSKMWGMSSDEWKFEMEKIRKRKRRGSGRG